MPGALPNTVLCHIANTGPRESIVAVSGSKKNTLENCSSNHNPEHQHNLLQNIQIHRNLSIRQLFSVDTLNVCNLSLQHASRRSTESLSTSPDTDRTIQQTLTVCSQFYVTPTHHPPVTSTVSKFDACSRLARSTFTCDLRLVGEASGRPRISERGRPHARILNACTHAIARTQVERRAHTHTHTLTHTRTHTHTHARTHATDDGAQAGTRALTCTRPRQLEHASSCKNAHARTHAHAQAHAHVHAHAHVRARTHTRIRTRARTNSRTRNRKPTHARTHAHASTHVAMAANHFPFQAPG